MKIQLVVNIEAFRPCGKKFSNTIVSHQCVWYTVTMHRYISLLLVVHNDLAHRQVLHHLCNDGLGPRVDSANIDVQIQLRQDDHGRLPVVDHECVARLILEHFQSKELQITTSVCQVVKQQRRHPCEVQMQFHQIHVAWQVPHKIRVTNGVVTERLDENSIDNVETSHRFSASFNQSEEQQTYIERAQLGVAQTNVSDLWLLMQRLEYSPDNVPTLPRAFQVASIHGTNVERDETSLAPDELEHLSTIQRACVALILNYI